MIETGVLFDPIGHPIYWHEPAGRTVASLPDDAQLWREIWKHRDHLGGFAHTHPGSGIPHPSQTDLDTFVAVERALGRELLWHILSADMVILCVVDSVTRVSVEVCSEAEVARFAPELRARSRYR